MHLADHAPVDADRRCGSYLLKIDAGFGQLAAQKHRKATRVRPADQALLPFDWEEAGWGVPAVDLVEFRLGRGRAALPP